MIQRLVINGCSYLKHYCLGNGHSELADALGIPTSVDLSEVGSCNSRIMRTTLIDAYNTSEKSFYIVGVTFAGRVEAPVTKPGNDGRWLSFTNSPPVAVQYEYPWTESDSKTYTELNLKANVLGLEDRARDTIVQVAAMVNAIKIKGHKVLIVSQCDDMFSRVATSPDLKGFVSKEIVNEYKWMSIPWQIRQGAKWVESDYNLPLECRHVAPGEHTYLNNFLVDYINQNDILK